MDEIFDLIESVSEGFPTLTVFINHLFSARQTRLLTVY